MIPCIAIFDIGKTNKKFLLFNLDLELVHEEQSTFEEVKDDEGENCEDLRAVSEWLLKTWERIQLNMDYSIRALNFTTYGASFVHLDANNRPITPLYNYLKKLPKSIEESFFNKYGPKETWSTQTASPALGMLNSGLQIYWLKHVHSSTYQKVKTSLHLPQFCSFLFTKHLTTEYTSIGCHTGLWDMSKNTYHDWVKYEGVDRLFPQIAQSYLSGYTDFRGEKIPVGTGLHDSSAALIPYFSKIKEPFLLVSTGTWCISLNPFSKKLLTKNELAQDCLNYMTFEGNKVMASRLFLGSFHENYTKRLSGHFFKDKDYYKKIQPDVELIEKANKKPKLLKDSVDPDKHFKPTDLDEFDSYEEAYHRLLIDMTKYQKHAILLAGEGLSEINTIFVDGGFNKNQLFMHLLQQHFPNKKVEAYDHNQGTALGGALVMLPYISSNKS